MTDKPVKCIFMIKFSIKDRSIQNEIQVLFYFLEIDFLSDTGNCLRNLSG